MGGSLPLLCTEGRCPDLTDIILSCPKSITMISSRGPTTLWGRSLNVEHRQTNHIETQIAEGAEAEVSTWFDSLVQAKPPQTTEHSSQWHERFGSLIGKCHPEHLKRNLYGKHNESGKMRRRVVCVFTSDTMSPVMSVLILKSPQYQKHVFLSILLLV